MAEKNIYPHFSVKNNEHPYVIYAFPILGILIKFILLIPVFFFVVILAIAFLILWIINSFYVLFTGNYWDTAYTFFVGLMKYHTKISLFLYGLTDQYPGFNFDNKGIFELEISKPAKPSRLLASPLLGFFIRILFIIPYAIFVNVMRNGTYVAVVLSWFAILIRRKYPESFYEFAHDSIRVGLAETMYMVSLSDTYPNFAISMNHQTIKILLIIAGAYLSFSGVKSNDTIHTNKPVKKIQQFQRPQYHYAPPTHKVQS